MSGIDKAKNASWGAMTFPLMIFLVIFIFSNQESSHEGHHPLC